MGIAHRRTVFRLAPAWLTLLWALLAAAADVRSESASDPLIDAPLDSSEEAGPDLATGPRDLLELVGVEASHFRFLVDGRDVDVNEQDTVLRFLYAVGRFMPADTERWAAESFDPAEQAAEPQRARGELFRLRGRVTRVVVEHPVPELVERLGADRYYRCTLELDGDAGTAEVFASAVPKAWTADAPLDERASAYGMFLKWAADGPARPVFAAARVAWHPQGVLGDLGMDTGLFDEVENRREITTAERECFYQLLSAAGRAPAADLIERTRRDPQHDYSVVSLFNDPETQHGELVALTGTAREAKRIYVGDADVQQRFGIDHYFQIEIFTADSQGNPIVFCVRELPPGMPEGSQIDEPVRIPGFFFKTWAYRTPRADPENPDRKQLAPMLIGRQPLWLRPLQQTGSSGGIVAAMLFVAAIVGLCLAVWRFHRSDARFHREVLAQHIAPKLNVPLDDIVAADRPATAPPAERREL
jgi:hypothetical protein